MGLFSSIVSAFSSKAVKAGMTAVTKMDSDTAINIELNQKEEKVKTIAGVLASAISRKNNIDEQLSQAKENKQKYAQAAKDLLTAGKTDNDPLVLEALGKAEDFSSQIKGLESDATQAAADVTQYTQSHANAVKSWQETRESLQKKIDQNARLTDQISQAKQAEQDAKTAAGLDTGVDTSAVISSTFDSENSKKEKELLALRSTTSALTSSGTTSSELDKFIDGEKPKQSVADRLKALED